MSNYNGGHSYAIDPRELNEKPITCVECDTQKGLIECSGDCQRDVCKVTESVTTARRRRRHDLQNYR